MLIGNEVIAKYLADLISNNDDMSTALMNAIEENQFDVVKFLVKNSYVTSGMALINAIRIGELSFSAEIISLGINDFDSFDKALVFAFYTNKINFIEFLLKQGRANLTKVLYRLLQNGIDYDGTYNEHILGVYKIAILLIKYGATIIDELMDLAYEKGNKEIILLFIVAGGYIKDKVLTEDEVKYLLSKNVSRDKFDNFYTIGDTPIQDIIQIYLYEKEVIGYNLSQKISKDVVQANINKYY